MVSDPPCPAKGRPQGAGSPAKRVDEARRIAANKFADMSLQRRLSPLAALPRSRAPCSSRVPASSSYRCAVATAMPASASASALDIFSPVRRRSDRWPCAVSSSADSCPIR